MGTARARQDKRDLSRHETVYVDPDYDRLREAAGLGNHAERVTRTVIAGGTSLETLGGLVAVVVAITGFSTLPFQMAGVGVIAIGIALLAQGLSVMSRWRDALVKFERAMGTKSARTLRPELKGGISTEVFAGVLGVVLGALGLAGIAPLVLLPASLIVYGGALLLGGAMQPDLVFLAPERNPKVARVTYDAIQTSGGIMVIVGIAAAVLGIVALVAAGPVLLLTLVGLLAIGASLLFAGGALTARLARPAMLRR
jgi:hypothetical protein